MTANEKLIRTTRLILRLLADEDYSTIEQLCGGIRLAATDISNAVAEYGRKVVMPPESTFENLDAIRIEDEVPASWSVRCHLWTEEEGKSDLSIVLTLTESSGDLMKAEFDDILVL